MSTSGRIIHGVLAVVALWFLYVFLIQVTDGQRPLGLLLLAAASLAWFTRQGSLLTLAVILPLGPIVNFPFLTPGRSIYAVEVILLGAMVAKGGHGLVAGGSAIEDHSRPGIDIPTMLWVSFAVIGLITLLLGHADLISNVSGQRGLRTLFLALVVVALFRQLGSDRMDRQRILRLWPVAAVAGLGLLAAGGLVEFLLAVVRGGEADEPGSFYRGSVGLAVHIAFLSPLALALVLMQAAGRWRYLTGLAWFLSLFCLLLTASRGAMASVMIATLVLVLLTARSWTRNQHRAAWIAAAFLTVVALVIFIKPEIAGESFAYKFRASVAGDFFSTRVNGWQEGMAAVRANPLRGDGPESWAPSIPLELARRYGLVSALLAMASMLMVASRIFSRRSATGGPDHGSSSSYLYSVSAGLAVCFLGFILVGFAETGLGAQMTPLVTSAICLSGWLVVASDARVPEDSKTGG